MERNADTSDGASVIGVSSRKAAHFFRVKML